MEKTMVRQVKAAELVEVEDTPELIKMMAAKVVITLTGRDFSGCYELTVSTPGNYYNVSLATARSKRNTLHRWLAAL